MNKTVTLQNGIEMPLLGLGIYAPGTLDEVSNAVAYALAAGYRMIDTASIYKNEEEVGKGILKSGIDRKEIFITSKVYNDEQGYEETFKAFDRSLNRLQTDYLDLYLIHWPVREHREATWKALEKLYTEGRVRAIGVSNYYEPHLEELQTYAEIMPMVNQFEFNPFLFLPDLLTYCKNLGIQPEGYAPLVRGKAEDNEVLNAVAQRCGKSTYQVLIRWSMQHGVVTIPKSVKKDRIEQNFDVWDFEISEEDMHLLNSFETQIRVAEDPMSYL
ncbi:aldo/keto reductase [Arundinibacter roseus]|uniref:Aldo/keto reductase n=1 Tax=Arundinibacter roseus TaxID=2070510 RepID=A0A4V2XAB5_9BACT|nr:aldo/keto reductase [Arundinibacter roseus]TDB67045.1 aldo/keto reductase [Arundinibacter roseus]